MVQGETRINQMPHKDKTRKQYIVFDLETHLKKFVKSEGVVLVVNHGCREHEHRYHDQQIEEFKYNNFTLRGITPNESQLINLRQQAWDYLIVKKAFQNELKGLDILQYPSSSTRQVSTTACTTTSSKAEECHNRQMIFSNILR